MTVNTENNLVPVFIISLVNSPRRQAISAHLHELGIRFSFIDAVEGVKLNTDEAQTINDSHWVRQCYKRKIGLGEIGCAYSHLSIYKNMLSRNMDWAIVLEDDAILDCNIQQLISENIKKLPINNLYLLGAQEDTGCEDMIVFSLWHKIKIANHFIFKKTISSAKYVYRASSYLIHRNVADRILEGSKDRFYLADDWLSFQREALIKDIYLSNVAHHPPLTPEQSTLEAERKANEVIHVIGSIKRIGIVLSLKKIKIYIRKILCIL